jgi:hypothetical protein
MRVLKKVQPERKYILKKVCLDIILVYILFFLVYILTTIWLIFYLIWHSYKFSLDLLWPSLFFLFFYKLLGGIGNICLVVTGFSQQLTVYD